MTTSKTLCALAVVLTILQVAHSLELTGVIRDFSVNHPDFEYVIATDIGIVQKQISLSDRKPVYNGNPTTPTTTGKDNFDQWYRDVQGVNSRTTLTIELLDEDNDGIYTYVNNAFFPIDGELGGNEDFSHNYHFTFEIHSQFTYEKGQEFKFSGDDDVWVFINNELVVDIGGVHTTLTGSVKLDDLGLTEGATYPFDFFFAERHTVESNFMIETSIELVQPPSCLPKPPKCKKKNVTKSGKNKIL